MLNSGITLPNAEKLTKFLDEYLKKWAELDDLESKEGNTADAKEDLLVPKPSKELQQRNKRDKLFGDFIFVHILLEVHPEIVDTRYVNFFIAMLAKPFFQDEAVQDLILQAISIIIKKIAQNQFGFLHKEIKRLSEENSLLSHKLVAAYIDGLMENFPSNQEKVLFEILEIRFNLKHKQNRRALLKLMESKPEYNFKLMKPLICLICLAESQMVYREYLPWLITILIVGFDKAQFVELFKYLDKYFSEVDKDIQKQIENMPGFLAWACPMERVRGLLEAIKTFLNNPSSRIGEFAVNALFNIRNIQKEESRRNICMYRCSFEKSKSVGPKKSRGIIC